MTVCISPSSALESLLQEHDVRGRQADGELGKLARQFGGVLALTAASVFVAGNGPVGLLRAAGPRPLANQVGLVEPVLAEGCNQRPRRWLPARPSIVADRRRSSSCSRRPSPPRRWRSCNRPPPCEMRRIPCLGGRSLH